MEETEKELSKIMKEKIKLEENKRDYSKQLENMKKGVKVEDETTDWREKLRLKNKFIDELQFENQVIKHSMFI